MHIVTVYGKFIFFVYENFHPQFTVYSEYMCMVTICAYRSDSRDVCIVTILTIYIE